MLFHPETWFTVIAASACGCRTPATCTTFNRFERTNIMPAKISVIGRRFGRLKIIGDAPSHYTSSGRAIRQVECLCDCGKTVIVCLSNLSGSSGRKTKSCGCLYRDTHCDGFDLVENRKVKPMNPFDYIEINPNGCWDWKGATSKAGYGIIMVYGKATLVHRYMWEVYNGKPIPEGLYCCHSCDRPCCCSPNHLFIGTPKDNTQDALKKGRLTAQVETLKRLWATKWKDRRGEQAYKSKLTTEQVLEMRRLHSEEGWGYERLRKHFGVSFGVAQRIINRKSWAHI